MKRIKSALMESRFRGARYLSPRKLTLLRAKRWHSTLFALPFFPGWVLSLFLKWDRQLSRILKPFGAFIVLEIE